MTAARPEEALRARGLLVTEQRVAILEAVAAQPHATVDAIAATVRASLGSVSKQAVYDGLHRLQQEGLLRRIQPVGSPARYETRVGDNHHHVICRGCGAVADVDCAVGAAPCLTAAEDHGFAIDEADVAYWGRCPDCQAAPSGGSPARARP